jgi:transposase InsO family protein
VIARFVHHVWMMDITEVRSFLGLRVFHVAGVFDAFSRVPLALRVRDTTPDTPWMARLLTATARTFGRPKYLITDLGGQFQGRIFAKAVGRLGIRHRFASALNIYATARLERFWRTLKDTARLRLLRPLTIEDLERRLEIALSHYIVFRPHQGLHGATPAEALLGLRPACAEALSPPRGSPGEGSGHSPFSVVYLDPQGRRFPFLEKAA